MTRATIEFDVPEEKLRQLRELQHRRRKAAPLLFRRTWACKNRKCDGEPHDGYEFKHARGSQVIPGKERIFYLVGGRGSGKTWAGAHNFAQMVLDTEPDPGDDHTEWAVIGPTYGDARDICIEGPSGLLRALGSNVADWNRSYGHLKLTNGALIYVDSANDGGQRIQGKNLYGAWAGEIGLWKTWKRAWLESLAFAVRKGQARIIADGTPKRSSLAKELLDDPEVGRRRLRTLDNISNLAKPAIDYLLNRYKGTTLGRQELEGLLVDDDDAALWKRSHIDDDRVESYATPFWQRMVIGIDPASGTEQGDEQGLARVGLSPQDHQLYVIESEGYRLGPWEFLELAVNMAVEHQASIAIEKNYGDAYLVEVLEQVMRKLGVRVPYRLINAKTSKKTRAEPVAGLYQQHKVHHVGHFADLEDQMCTWTGLGNEPSPDRLDALVYACLEFTNYALEAPPLDGDKAVQWSDDLVPGGAVRWQ